MGSGGQEPLSQHSSPHTDARRRKEDPKTSVLGKNWKGRTAKEALEEASSDDQTPREEGGEEETREKQAKAKTGPAQKEEAPTKKTGHRQHTRTRRI